MTRKTIQIAIGNSDDRLTQREWHEFVGAVDLLVRRLGDPIHGSWTSPSRDPYQNAAWALSVPSDAARDELRVELARIAGVFRQDSVAWNESHTEFLRPDGGTEPLFPLHGAHEETP